MSSSDVAISVRGLSKAYTIVHGGLKRPSFREAVVERIRRPFHRPETETFWALKDVEFDIKQGDVVGIIGRNGAGKSTLLKILSRITEPTHGQIDVYGRIGSLLEVGTGFHPELTGRENIYLNGAILGMRRAEITRQFDAIVDFAGVERFLDTPVKRYSSGMYVRLAFAVAAHLRTDILVVDEVLAVGDTEFQRKCLGKMKDVASGGRTVLFVSHNMAAISALCNKGLVLRNGCMVFAGGASESLEFYGDSARQVRQTADINAFRASSAKPYIRRARILGEDNIERATFPLAANITVEIDFDTGNSLPLKVPVMGVVIKRLTGVVVGGINSLISGFAVSTGSYTKGTMRCRLQSLPILQGEYVLELWLSDGITDLDQVDGYLRFSIEDADIYSSGRPPNRHLGEVFFRAEWELDKTHNRVLEIAS